MIDVLLVDDEEGVRSTLAKMLEQGGFSVVAVNNGLQAVAELQQQPFGAIVTDILMPFLEGRRFYDELASERPEMTERVVFVTGWSDDKQVRAIAERTGRPVLRKPVRAQELVGAVREVFEQSGVSEAPDPEET